MTLNRLQFLMFLCFASVGAGYRATRKIHWWRNSREGELAAGFDAMWLTDRPTGCWLLDTHRLVAHHSEMPSSSLSCRLLPSVWHGLVRRNRRCIPLVSAVSIIICQSGCVHTTTPIIYNIYNHISVRVRLNNIYNTYTPIVRRFASCQSRALRLKQWWRQLCHQVVLF